MMIFFRILNVIAWAFCIVIAFSPLTLATQLFLIACLGLGPALILDSIMHGSPRKRKTS